MFLLLGVEIVVASGDYLLELVEVEVRGEALLALACRNRLPILLDLVLVGDILREGQLLDLLNGLEEQDDAVLEALLHAEGEVAEPAQVVADLLVVDGLGVDLRLGAGRHADVGAELLHQRLPCHEAGIRVSLPVNELFDDLPLELSQMVFEVQHSQILVGLEVLLDILLDDAGFLVEVEAVDGSEVTFESGEAFQHLFSNRLLIVDLQVAERTHAVEALGALFPLEVELVPLDQLAAVATHVGFGLVLALDSFVAADTSQLLVELKLLFLVFEGEMVLAEIVLACVSAVQHHSQLHHHSMRRPGLLVQKMPEVVALIFLFLQGGQSHLHLADEEALVLVSEDEVDQEITRHLVKSVLHSNDLQLGVLLQPLIRLDDLLLRPLAPAPEQIPQGEGTDLEIFFLRLLQLIPPPHRVEALENGHQHIHHVILQCLPDGLTDDQHADDLLVQKLNPCDLILTDQDDVGNGPPHCYLQLFNVFQQRLVELREVLPHAFPLLVPNLLHLVFEEDLEASSVLFGLGGLLEEVQQLFDPLHHDPHDLVALHEEPRTGDLFLGVDLGVEAHFGAYLEEHVLLILFGLEGEDVQHGVLEGLEGGGGLADDLVEEIFDAVTEHLVRMDGQDAATPSQQVVGAVDVLDGLDDLLAQTHVHYLVLGGGVLVLQELDGLVARVVKDVFHVPQGEFVHLGGLDDELAVLFEDEFCEGESHVALVDVFVVGFVGFEGGDSDGLSHPLLDAGLVVRLFLESGLHPLEVLVDLLL